MKIKRELFILHIFYITILCFLLIIAQEDELQSNDTNKTMTSDEPLVPQIPGSDLFGEIDEEEGLPKSLVELRDQADKFKNREQNKSFLAQEWTVFLAENKFLGPVLFYTDKVFSLFNPLWEIIFGLKFSWAWEFFLGLFLWSIIIFIVYFPGKALMNNNLFGFITGIIVATITGLFGVLKAGILFFTPFIINLWHLGFLIIIAILLATIYEKIFANLQKKSEEEELKRSKENIKALGKISEEGLEELGDEK